MSAKRLLPVIFTIVFALASFSAYAGKNDPVTMASFEQGWLDDESTIALKNNTESTIHSVTFQIIYTDMNGNQMDYETYTKDVDIAPGMTKKVDIPAYEHERNYSYYHSEARPYQPHRFKVKFVLKSYNSQQAETIDTQDDSTMVYADESDVVNYSNHDNSPLGIILGSVLGIIIVIAIIGLYFGLYVAVAVMAKHRGRSVVAWLLLSLFLSPLLCIILLWAVGYSNKNNRNTNDFPQDEDETYS